MRSVSIDDGLTDAEGTEDGFMVASIMWQKAICQLQSRVVSQWRDNHGKKQDPNDDSGRTAESMVGAIPQREQDGNIQAQITCG